MLTVSRLATEMQTVFIDEANRLAEETGLIERYVEITGSSFARGLVSGWQNNPQASLACLSQAIGNAGTPITRQALNQRFDGGSVKFAHALLKRSLEVVVTAMPVEQSLLNRFTTVELVDSSIITLPNTLQDIWQGTGGFGENASVSSLKLNVRLEAKYGQLQHLDISDGKQHDKKSQAHQAPVAKGGLRIEDLGYYGLDDLEQIDEQDAYFLMRYKQKTYVYGSDGVTQLDLAEVLPDTIGDTVDWDIHLGKVKQLPCRMVAEKVPPEVVAQRHERLREEARQNQREVTEEALIMAQWTIYITNVPREMLHPTQVFILGRYRWQIELLFKLWKQDLGVDKWRTKNPHRILTEIYLKLVGAIVAHWVLLVACWHHPRRSLRQAIPTIRGLAWQIANSMSQHDFLVHALQAACRALSCCYMDKSQQHPRVFQLLCCAIA